MTVKKDTRAHGNPFTWAQRTDKSWMVNFKNVPDNYSTLKNIRFVLREKPEDNHDKYLVLYWKGSDATNATTSKFIFDPQNHEVVVCIEPNDFDNIINNTNYKVYIEFETTDYPGKWLKLISSIECYIKFY